jgi:CelD/BcsL family acetyltransferase involved in cellulose biosynthesis
VTIRFERVALGDVPWTELDAWTDRTVGQTRGWLGFLAASQGAEPIVAQVTDGSDALGWFTGGIVRRGGIRQLGSPLRGWTTPAMGCNLAPGADRVAVLEALPRFAFGPLRCLHLEYADRAFGDGAPPPGYRSTPHPGYVSELVDDDRLLAAMTTNGRRNIKKAQRLGITVEVVDPAAPGTFAAEFHEHLTAAFATRGVAPTYPVERVEQLIDHVGPTGSLLLVRARTAEGAVAGAAIFPGLHGGTAEFFGGASRRDLLHLCPNEALMWTAMRTWRERGATHLDFGGGGDYKRKYGGTPHELSWLRRSRFEVLERGRAAALAARGRVRARSARRHAARN